MYRFYVQALFFLNGGHKVLVVLIGHDNPRALEASGSQCWWRSGTSSPGQRNGLRFGTGSEPALDLPWWRRVTSALNKNLLGY